MKKCKECGREEWGFLSSLNEDGYCPTCAFHHNQDKIKRLQEQIKDLKEQIKELEGYRRKTQQQLDDANKLLQYECSGLMDVKFYLKKWGVK